MSAWVTGAAVALTMAGCWTDLRSMRIPNALTAGFAAGGLLYHSISGGWAGLAASLFGGAAGIFPLLVLYRLGGIGAGDVKWFGAFGIWTGAGAVWQLFIFSVLIAGLLSAALLLLRLPGLRRAGMRLPWPWGRHPALPGKGAVFPFMLAVAPAFAFVWLQP